MASAISRPTGWRIWLLAARPATLPAAVVPVLVGSAAAVPLAEMRWVPFVAALVASILIQIGTNYANDLFDFLKGADHEGRLGPTRITQSGLASVGAVGVATALVFGLAVVLGLYLAWVGGWPIILVGVLAILAGLAYTGGPYPLGYHGLGDVFCFVFFGLVAVMGSAYLQTLTLAVRVLLAALPVGALVTAILVVNNVRDIPTDRVAGKKTLAVRLGDRGARSEYALLVIAGYVVVLAMVWRGDLGWWGLLPLATLPLALNLCRTLWKVTDPGVLNAALKGTGRLHLLFGLALTAAFWLS
ncbi:MAG: 1,4-dihydroxy-2-naphthoate polyprenyltransferase [Chloroflexota bacterium]